MWKSTLLQTVFMKTFLIESWNVTNDNNNAPLSATVKSTSHYKYRVRKEKCRHYTLRYGLRLGFNLISYHTVLPLGSDFL